MIDQHTPHRHALRPKDLLWPEYATPTDLAAIKAVPLEARGLPESTYALAIIEDGAVATTHVSSPAAEAAVKRSWPATRSGGKSW